MMDTSNPWKARAEVAEAEMARLQKQVDELSCWIIEANAAFSCDNKPAESLDDCLGLVRMCYEGAAALCEVERLHTVIGGQ